MLVRHFMVIRGVQVSDIWTFEEKHISRVEIGNVDEP